MITPNKQITLNQILDILEDIASKHGQIKAFYFGDIEDYHPVEALYPMMWVTVGEAFQRMKEVEYDIHVVILDRLETDKTNLKQVLSDTLQILFEVLSLLKYGSQIYNLIRIGDYIQQQGTGTQLIRATGSINQDIVDGWNGLLKIRVDYVNDICSIPGINGTEYTLP